MGRRGPRKVLVNETTLVSPVCPSKLVGEGEIELARGEGSGAAVVVLGWESSKSVT